MAVWGSHAVTTSSCVSKRVRALERERERVVRTLHGRALSFTSAVCTRFAGIVVLLLGSCVEYCNSFLGCCSVDCNLAVLK